MARGGWCAQLGNRIVATGRAEAGEHVFVERPHRIDPVGVRRMRAVG